MVPGGFPMNTEKSGLLPQPAPEFLVGNHCSVRHRKGARFGLKENGPTLGGRLLAHHIETPDDFLPGKADVRSHSTQRTLPGW